MAKKTRSRLAALTLLEIAAGIAVTAVAVPALAADLPTKAPIVVAPSYNWTGFYLGGHAGYRWADADFSSSAYSFDPGGGIGTFGFPARNEGYNLGSGILGVHAGYNHLVSPNLLLGLEGDFSWGRGKDSQTQKFNLDGTEFLTNEIKLDWQATIRGRAGIVNGNWLFYGTGGVAFINVNWANTATATTTGGTLVYNQTWNGSKTSTGWVIGAGSEYMLDKNWLARIEYLYERFGSFNIPHGFGPQTGTLDIGSVQKLRVGISYKFGP